MFRFFETRIDFRKQPPEEPPPDTLWGFYWHFIAQAKGLFIALFALGFVLAIFEALIPYLIGRLVNALSHTSPEGIFSEAGPLLITMAAVILLVRPFGTILFRLLVNHSLAVSFTTMVHWQNYWHVVRQPLAFFQDDFAGRIANRVLQTGRPLRESILSVARAVWQILIFGAASIGLLGTQDIRLALPMAGWFTLYALLLVVALPRIQKRSRVSSEARSAVTGKVVDSFTNIMTVKLFGRRKEEDDYISEGYSRLNDAFMSQQRVNTVYVAALTLINAVFLVATGAMAVWLFSANRIDAGTMTTALLLSTQIVSMSGWVAFEVMSIFENVGTVQEGMKTISRPLAMQDLPDAKPLNVSRGEIRFENVSFSYGDGDTVHRRARPHHPPGREDRPRRPLRRRQDHARQPAPALLRAAGGPHPDRRPGHRRREGGEPARADLRGDAGHLPAAPLDQGEHPLRAATGRATRRWSRQRARRMPRTSSSGSPTGADGASSRRMWASAA